MLAAFNKRAEALPDQLDPSSFTSLVAGFRSSPEFMELSPKTKKDYGRYLNKLVERFGSLPYKGINRQVVYALRDSMKDKPRTANYVLQVLRRLLGWAVDHGLIEHNPALRPRQLKTAPREAVWTDEQQQAFLDIASPAMTLAFMLGICTAQRQADILALTWHQYDGTILSFRQQKTGKTVEVPCLNELKAVLDAAPRLSPNIVTDERGRPFKTDRFRKLFRAAREKAGVEGVEFRDLRRTFVVRAAREGVPIAHITAITGHDIDFTQKILETYLPRDRAMGQAAIDRLEDVRRKKSGVGSNRKHKVGNNG